MIGAMDITGGPLGLTYNLMAPASPVVLETSSYRGGVSHRSNSLVGRDPYTEVLISFRVTVLGATEDDAWNQYAIFADFMQGISVFRQRPYLTPYLFKVQPKSGGRIWQTMIMGGDSLTSEIIGPPSDPVSDTASMWVMQGIEVRFRVKGRSIDAVNTIQASIGATQIGLKMVFDLLANQTCDSPINVVLTDTTPGTACPTITDGLVIIANRDSAQSAIVEIDGTGFTSFSSAPPFTAPNDSTNSPTSGATVRAFTAPDNGFYTMTTPNATYTPHRRNLIFVMVKNLTLNASCQCILQIINTADGNVFSSEYRPIIGDQSAGILCLGVLALPANLVLTNVTIRLAFTNTTTGLSVVYVDRVYLVNIDLANLTIFYHGALAKTTNTPSTHSLDQRYLTAINPDFYGGSGIIAGRVRGSLHTSAKSRYVEVLWLTPNGPRWRWQYTATTTPRSMTGVIGLFPASVYPRAT
jgi:hypothetical protein